MKLRSYWQEIALLQDSIHTLKMAQSKFQESKRSIEKAEKYKVGQPLLVPLTGSVITRMYFIYWSECLLNIIFL